MDEVSYVNPKDINGLNLYAYCNNNPIMYYDPSGRFNVYISPFTNVFKKIISKFSFKEYHVDTKGMEPITLENGTPVYYEIIENNTPDKTILKIYNSYELTASEMEEFLSILETEKNIQGINEERVMNEWMWHKVAYEFGYSREQTASVDVYFNHDDEGHKVFSWVMNNVNIYNQYKNAIKRFNRLVKSLKFI